jgi:hypothetical protein
MLVCDRRFPDYLGGARAYPISLLALLAVSGCQPDDTDVPTIGVLIDHSGSIARPAWRDAALLALEHTNQGLQRVPAWKGVRFSLRFADSARGRSYLLTLQQAF